MRVYLNANALIRAVEGGDEAHRLLRRIMVIGRPAATIVTSRLTYPEVLGGPLKRLRLDETDAGARQLFAIYQGLLKGRVFIRGDDRNALVEVVELEAGLLLDAAYLKASRQAMKLPDAIHVASARWANCDALISNDKNLRNVAAGEGLSPCSLDPMELKALLAKIGAAP